MIDRQTRQIILFWTLLFWLWRTLWILTCIVVKISCWTMTQEVYFWSLSLQLWTRGLCSSGKSLSTYILCWKLQCYKLYNIRRLHCYRCMGSHEDNCHTRYIIEHTNIIYLKQMSPTFEIKLLFSNQIVIFVCKTKTVRIA